MPPHLFKALSDGGLPLAVIVPCRNERHFIRCCLLSLLQQEDLPSHISAMYQVVVVDGCSDDGSVEEILRLQQHYPRLLLLHNPKKNAAAALNQGICYTRAQIIVRVDVHAIYAKDYLACCLRALQRHGAANVGGAARALSKGPWQKAIAAAFHSPCSTGGALFHQSGYEGPVDTVTFGCWPLWVFKQVGLFDETLLCNQDDEHNFRLKKHRLLVWQDRQICLWYVPRHNLLGLWRQYARYGYYRFYVICKHRQIAAIRHLVPAVFMGFLWLEALLALVYRHWQLAVFLPALYGCFILIVACHLAYRHKSVQLFFYAIPVLMTYHFSYGSGFWLAAFKEVTERCFSAMRPCRAILSKCCIWWRC